MDGASFPYSRSRWTGLQHIRPFSLPRYVTLYTFVAFDQRLSQSMDMDTGMGIRTRMVIKRKTLPS